MAAANDDTFEIGIVDPDDEQPKEKQLDSVNKTSKMQTNSPQTKHKPSIIDSNVLIKKIVDEAPQYTFFDDLIEYTEKAIYTITTYTSHLIPLTLGIACLQSKDRNLTYTFAQTCFVAWIMYYSRVGTGDNYIYDDEYEPPLMQSIYFNLFAYTGLSYLTHFPYFTHFGALHIACDTSRRLYKRLMTPKK